MEERRSSRRVRHADQRLHARVALRRARQLLPDIRSHVCADVRNRVLRGCLGRRELRVRCLVPCALLLEVECTQRLVWVLCHGLLRGLQVRGCAEELDELRERRRPSDAMSTM